MKHPNLLNTVAETLKDKKGKYGRYIGELYILEKEWINVNALLIKEGLAEPY